MTSITHRTAALGAAAILLAGPLVAAPPADAASALPCHASMSDPTPKQYTYDDVRVTSVASAYVHTVAHYKTTNTPKNGRANSAGHASIEYYISGATPGYRVHVSVTVHKNGHTGSCSTSFVPHR